MKAYTTFGQAHRHTVNETIYDKDCVAEIECSSLEEGRAKAFELFGTKFCFQYSEEHFDFNSMHYFPRGIIKCPPETKPNRDE